MVILADREQVLAFRLDSHNLTRRLPAGSLLRAAGACGLQNTPPGSAALALLARICDLVPGDIEIALATDKTLLQAWSLRAAPAVFPTRDVALFTLGLLPVKENDLRLFIPGVQPALDILEISALQVLSLAGAAVIAALDGCMRTKDELGIELAKLVASKLSPYQAAKWESPSWVVPGQSLGESVMRFMLPVLALQGLCCHAHRRGNKAFLSRPDQWLGSPLPADNPERAQAELVRRYLHCYGPSTPGHFAAWAGITEGQAGERWRRVARELLPVQFNGQTIWLHQADLDRFHSPEEPTGVRMLPPHDPFLQLRDRETLVPDESLHRHIWQSSGNPGVIVAQGQYVGLWRPKKKGTRLDLSMNLIRPLSAEVRAEIEAEAALLAIFRGCRSVTIEYSSG